ncbi:MAG: NADPH:quinone reductase [Thermoleophilaceae bacterium]|jgi:NADPH2:quinone reductase|nr:NADPH:quinone reductase [Thermoleophilaceae bacterium]
MRAIRIDEWGGPEVMQVVEMPEPVPADGELLIEVSHAGVNFADTHQRENNYIARYELPLVPGGEVVGIARSGALEGQRVVAMTGTGGYAEFATAREDTTFPLPAEVDDGQALALLIQGLTAWHLYRTCARIQPGESVVVHSAAGGVGSLAVQLAKPMGAGRVIATASSSERREFALSLGADLALDPEDDLPEEVDIVFEAAGGSLFERSFEALAPFGRVIQYGLSTREKSQVSNAKLLRTSRGVIGFWLMHCIGRPGMLREPLADLFERAARGEVVARVGEAYPLAEVARAHEDLLSRRTSGKLIVDPSIA